MLDDFERKASDARAVLMVEWARAKVVPNESLEDVTARTVRDMLRRMEINGRFFCLN